MSEPVTALGGAVFNGIVSVREMPLRGMITLRGDLSAGAITKSVTDISDQEMPGKRRINAGDERGILWMSPDELLLLLPYDMVDQSIEDLRDTLSGEHALVADVSDARASFELNGSGLRDVLAKLTPADMSRDGLPVGEVRRTRLAQVPAAFWLVSETRAQVVCFRSVADYVFTLLKTAAQRGSEVGFH